MQNLIKNSWNNILKNEFTKQYFKNIVSFLENEKKAWKTIYPEEKNIFRALELTDFDHVKVVIIWQDPYHQPNQAQWLAFSVPEWVKIPPSLKNIYKEIWKKEIKNWNLEAWTKQWVLLLNAILTVEENRPTSHSKIWWETFTDNIITQISEKKENVVFLLWWAFAKSKANLIDKKKHLILETSHPSPLWSFRWFLWSKCFQETNKYLKSKWKKEIKW